MSGLLVLAHRVIPVVLHRGHTVVKGERFNSWRSVGHVMQAISIYDRREVDEITLLDIAATPEGRGPDFAMVEQLSEELFCPITVGGGVRRVEDVKTLLRVGADKVAIGRGAHMYPTLLRECCDKFGRQAIVATIDVLPDGKVRFMGAGPGPVGWARWLDQQGAIGEILLTSVAREGTMEGYDLDLIRAVSEAVEVPVIANGGCSGYEDMVAAIKAGASAVAAGALFTFTDATPLEAALYLQEHGIEARV